VFFTGKTYHLSVMEQSSLLGQLVSYKECCEYNTRSFLYTLE